VNSLHRVRVLGREVQVRTTASPDQVRDIETFVNETVTELQTSMKTTDMQVVAIMALLNLGESCLLQSRENVRLQRVMSERIFRLLRQIDEAVGRP